MNVGDKQGRWTVLGEIQKSGRKYYECRCDCGTVRVVYYRSLESGMSQSCGCLRRDLQQENARDLTGEVFGRLTVLRRDETKIGYWLCLCECGNRKSIRGTSLLKATRSCGCIQKEVAAVRGGSTIDKNSKEQTDLNRELNTNVQVIKTKTPPKNNQSGFKGVWYDKTRGLWTAYIQLHGKRKFLGRYAQKEDAVKARLVAEEMYFEPILKAIESGEVEKYE